MALGPDWAQQTLLIGPCRPLAPLPPGGLPRAIGRPHLVGTNGRAFALENTARPHAVNIGAPQHRALRATVNTQLTMLHPNRSAIIVVPWPRQGDLPMEPVDFFAETEEVRERLKRDIRAYNLTTDDAVDLIFRSFGNFISQENGPSTAT
jgi:hypothetical protein